MKKKSCSYSFSLINYGIFSIKTTLDSTIFITVVWFHCPPYMVCVCVHVHVCMCDDVDGYLFFNWICPALVLFQMDFLRSFVHSSDLAKVCECAHPCVCVREFNVQKCRIVINCILFVSLWVQHIAVIVIIHQTKIEQFLQRKLNWIDDFARDRVVFQWLSYWWIFVGIEFFCEWRLFLLVDGLV